MHFNLVNNEEMLLLISCASGSMMEQFAQQSAILYICAQAQVGHAASAQRLFGTTLGRVLWGLCFFFKPLFFSSSAFLIFLQPSHYLFFSSLSLSTVITVCRNRVSSMWGLMAALWRLLKSWTCFTVQGLADHSGGPWTPRAPTFHSARCSCY